MLDCLPACACERAWHRACRGQTAAEDLSASGDHFDGWTCCMCAGVSGGGEDKSAGCWEKYICLRCENHGWERRAGWSARHAFLAPRPLEGWRGAAYSEGRSSAALWSSSAHSEGAEVVAVGCCEGGRDGGCADGRQRGPQSSVCYSATRRNTGWRSVAMDGHVENTQRRDDVARQGADTDVGQAAGR